jgi:hypothetical protein
MGVKWVIHIALLCFPSQVFAQNGNFLAYPGIFDFLENAVLEVSDFFLIRLLPRNAACKGGKVLIFVAFMKSFFAKHGENRAFLGQIVEILKCSPFIMFISHNCNQTTTQPKKCKFFDIHEIRICVQLQLQLQNWL